jgi:PAS domain S-box-containing protein
MADNGGGIRVLHVDDDPAFADTVAAFLQRENDRVTVETATNAESGLEHLDAADVDCVVSDYEMPGTDGLEFLEAVRERHPELPFVLFTGKGSETIASEAISAGVTDYLQKAGGTSQFTVLANRVENAVAGYRARQRLETERDQYRQLFEAAPVMYVVTTEEAGDPVITECNRQFADRLGYDRETVVGRPLADFYTEASARRLTEEGGYDRALAGEFVTEERSFETADGETVETLLRAVPRRDDAGSIVGTLTLYVDVT